MPTPELSDQDLIDALNLAAKYGSPHMAFQSGASKLPKSTLRNRVNRALLRGLKPTFSHDAPRIHAQQRLGKMHLVIPDGQVKVGVNTDHWEWIGNYIVSRQPDVLVNIGDFWDMPSLSSYDKGKLEAEGRRYVKDVDAGKAAMERLLKPIDDYNRTAAVQYKPRMVFTLGNHEHRITRVCDENPAFAGKFDLSDLGIKDYGWEQVPFLKIVKTDGIEYCLCPEHKVLTADLRYVPLRSLSIGDTLLAFDEESSSPRVGRRYKTAVVEKLDIDQAELFEVKLSDGKIFRATLEHQWLVRKPCSSGYVWRTTADLAAGKNKWRLGKLFPEWDTATSYDAGWMAGILDGEGWISKPNATQGGIQLGVAQNIGLVLSKIKDLLEMFGASVNSRDMPSTKSCKAVRVLGPSGAKLALLGALRPLRLLQKFKPEMLGRVQLPDNGGAVYVESVTPIGVGDIAKIRTSTRTMIVEGYPHHNCHYFTSGVMGRPCASAATLLRERQCSATQGHVQHTDIAMHRKTQQTALFAGTCYTHDENYLGAQGNDQRRQIIVKHEVDEGRYDLMMVSLNFLKKAYS